MIIRFFLFGVLLCQLAPIEARSRKADLGFEIFSDVRLSSPEGQACASCHNPEHFFVDPDATEPTSEGVIEGRYGPRNAPTLLYAAKSPRFHFDSSEGLFIGGEFDDGRATDLVAQAKGPFLEPLEMNNPSMEAVVEKVRGASYADLFRSVYGPRALDDPKAAYDRIADALSAYESSRELSPFASKYDRYVAGQAEFTDSERRGREIYERSDKGNCAACHPSRAGHLGRPGPLFTDYSYDNLGVPRNAQNAFYDQSRELNPLGWDFRDEGLGRTVRRREEIGKFKVPTLRNIEKTAPYMHNGYFKTLLGVIDFYSTRDLKPTCPDPLTPEEQALKMGCWPAPETALNVNHSELGKLGLSRREMLDLEAFLKTLTDQRP